jgi:integrase
MEIELRYLMRDRDRHGTPRYYVRVPGRKKVRLRETPGSEEFLAAYAAAMAGVSQSDKPGQGSFRALCILYYGSPSFRGLDVSTQGWQRRALDGIAVKHGGKPVRLMQARHVRKIRDEILETPAAANLRVKALKAMFAWAVEEEEAPHDPTLGVKKIRYVTRGHNTASADEIEQYKKRHKVGTKARLAFDLLRYTTGRREDIPLLGPGHVKGGRIKFRQQKNKDRKPIDVDLPLHPELAASIKATPSGHMTFLVTDYGKAYTTAGFGNAMRDWFNQANLPHLSAHSCRKGTAAELAEGGASPHEIMAVTGHTTLEQVEVYTRDARKKKLADRAMRKIRT